MLRTPWSLMRMVLLVSLWLATVCNLPLWLALWHLPDVSGLRGALFGLVFSLMIASAIIAVQQRACHPEQCRYHALGRERCCTIRRSRECMR